MNKKAVVIFSGGQDSTTCLGWAMKNFEEVVAISFHYGQKHSIEMEQAKEICKKHNIEHTIIEADFFGNLVESALTHNGNVNEKHPKNNNLPASFVPNRNAFFITLAHAYAQKIGASNLVTGVCQTDFSGYPDCRRVFINAIEVALNMGSDTDIIIHTPLMYLTKAETFKLAKEVNILEDVINLSHTCYNGDREHNHDWGYGCGECPACKLREKGYEEYVKTFS